MIKKITAVLLIFVIVLCATSCKIEKTPGEEKPYFVDEEGHTQYVEKDGDGKYYYIDSEGVTTYIEDEKQIEQIKEIEEQIAQKELQEIADGNVEDHIENANKDDKLQISDGLIKEEASGDKTDDAKSKALARIKSYQDLLKTKKFTITGTIMQSDGEDMSYPIVYIRNGEDFFIEAAIPIEEGKVVKANMIYLDGTAYCVIPSMMVYYNAGSDIGDEMGVGTFSDAVVDKYTFAETSNVTINGKTYICDKFTYEGDTYKYIYDSSNNLVRIEEIYSEKNYVIAEIKSMSPTADTSKIKKPKGVDITSMID